MLTLSYLQRPAECPIQVSEVKFSLINHCVLKARSHLSPDMQHVHTLQLSQFVRLNFTRDTPRKPHPARALDLSSQLISNMDIHEACAPFFCMRYSGRLVKSGKRNENIAEAKTWPFCWQSHWVWVQTQTAKLLVSRDGCQIATSTMSGWLKIGITQSDLQRAEGGNGL